MLVENESVDNKWKTQHMPNMQNFQILFMLEKCKPCCTLSCLGLNTCTLLESLAGAARDSQSHQSPATVLIKNKEQIKYSDKGNIHLRPATNNKYNTVNTKNAPVDPAVAKRALQHPCPATWTRNSAASVPPLAESSLHSHNHWWVQFWTCYCSQTWVRSHT